MTAEAEGTETLSLTFSVRDSGSIGLAYLGVQPYALIAIEDATDDALALSVEVGGGIPDDRAGIATLLEGIAATLREGEVLPTASTEEASGE